MKHQQYCNNWASVIGRRNSISQQRQTFSLAEIMKRQTATILILILTTLFSCKNDRKFPEVKKLSAYKNTQFIPTLEHKISNKKNSVYCATLLFAWDEIRKQINSPLTISDEYFDLKLLNKSTSFENVLKSNEYNVSVDVDGDLITARAEFNKSLPFELKLQNFNNKLTFDGQKVSSFGVYGYDDYEQLKIVQIVYYKNDNNFIIKLLPKDKEHEIVLFNNGSERINKRFCLNFVESVSFHHF